MPSLVETANASNGVGSSSVDSVGAAYVLLDRTQENWDETKAEETADGSFLITEEEESCSEAIDSATTDSSPSVVSSDDDASTVSNSRQMRRPFLCNRFMP